MDTGPFDLELFLTIMSPIWVPLLVVGLVILLVKVF
jgi:hypothetical protein